MGVIAWEVLCGGSTLPYDGIADDKVRRCFFRVASNPFAWYVWAHESEGAGL